MVRSRGRQGILRITINIAFPIDVMTCGMTYEIVKAILIHEYKLDDRYI